MAKKGSKWSTAQKKAHSRRIKLWHAARARENATAKGEKVKVKTRSVKVPTRVGMVAPTEGDMTMSKRLALLETGLTAMVEIVRTIRDVVGR